MKHQGPASVDPREPIIRRLAERLGVPIEAIAGDGTNPPRIGVNIAAGLMGLHTIEYRWGTPGAPTSLIEIHPDGILRLYGNPPETWEPAITISTGDLVAALNDAARDMQEMFNAGH